MASVRTCRRQAGPIVRGAGHTNTRIATREFGFVALTSLLSRCTVVTEKAPKMSRTGRKRCKSRIDAGSTRTIDGRRPSQSLEKHRHSAATSEANAESLMNRPAARASRDTTRTLLTNTTASRTTTEGGTRRCAAKCSSVVSNRSARAINGGLRACILAGLSARAPIGFVLTAVPSINGRGGAVTQSGVTQSRRKAARTGDVSIWNLS